MTSWSQIENKAPEKTLLFLWDESRQEGNVFAVLCIFSSFISVLEWSQRGGGGKTAPGPLTSRHSQRWFWSQCWRRWRRRPVGCRQAQLSR